MVWDGHGWMVCSLSRSLTLPSLVSRDGWDGHGPQYVSLGVPPHPTTTCIARTTNHASTPTHVSASCDPPAVHARPQRPCGDLALASPRMSSPLTLLSLSLTNPLPSGALMLTGMMGFERHERIGCGWDGTASVTRSDDALKGGEGGALYLSKSTATVSGATFTLCSAVRR